ncbi:hypothetical protein BDZ89DRAFT_275703 [Hymenopellis radicata]|nr:hypothetical protein BDZ89DRAFT_275703 [Hymenopellis radicata]
MIPGACTLVSTLTDLAQTKLFPATTVCDDSTITCYLSWMVCLSGNTNLSLPSTRASSRRDNDLPPSYHNIMIPVLPPAVI